MRIEMKCFVCAFLVLVAASSFAHAGSCGIHQTIADWKNSDQGPAEIEKVMTVFEKNGTNGFYNCDPGEAKRLPQPVFPRGGRGSAQM
jgi:hypothetical protein